MDPKALSIIGQVAGLAGIAIALTTLVFRDVIRKKIFPTLTKQQAYSLLRLIVILSSILALAGIAAWAYITATSPRDPVAELRKRVDKAFEVPSQDRELFSDFLKQSGAQIFRIYPRGNSQWIEQAGINGGGSYYSFLQESHEHGQGNELGYESGNFYTGFAGADYGYILSVGDVAITELATSGPNPPSWLASSEAEGWNYLWTYRPPSDIKEIRRDQEKSHGLLVGGSRLSETVAAVENTSYLLRAIMIDEADLLIAFRAHRKLDGSFVIVGKIIKTFATPVATESEP